MIQWYVLRSPKKNYEVALCVDDCSACVAMESSVFALMGIPSLFPVTMPQGKPYSDDLHVALVNMARHLDIGSIIRYTRCSQRVLKALLEDYQGNGTAIQNHLG